MWDVPCPAYDRQYQEVLQSPAFQKLFRGSNAYLINYLEKYSGTKVNSPSDVYDIYQALLAQVIRKFSLSWSQVPFLLVLARPAIGCRLCFLNIFLKENYLGVAARI